MFGNIKEYRVIEITKKILEKNKWSLEEFDKKDIEFVNEILDNNGFVLALGKKLNKIKVAKGLYIFKKEVKNNEIVCVFDKAIFVEDIREEVILEFENVIDDYLGAAVSEQQVKRAYFRDKEYELKKVKVGKFEISAFVLWILWGLMMSVCLDNFMWLCFGVCFATTSSYVIKVNGKIIAVKDAKRKKSKVTKGNKKKDIKEKNKKKTNNK